MNSVDVVYDRCEICSSPADHLYGQCWYCDFCYESDLMRMDKMALSAGERMLVRAIANLANRLLANEGE